MDQIRIFGVIFAAILGGVLGSFANVLIIRWHDEAPLGGRSMCPKCKKVLKPHQLIPILSWFMLRGRCASCSKKIHFQYPLVEAVAAALGAIAAARHDPFMDWVFWHEFILTWGLIVPVVMDIRWKELPLEFMVGLGIFGAASNLYLARALGWESAGFLALAIAAPVAFFGLQILVSRGRWLGSGDVWFGAMMGGALAWPSVLFGVYLAYLFGGLAAVIGLAGGWLKRGSRLPFGPALAAGMLCALWFGPQLLNLFRYGHI